MDSLSLSDRAHMWYQWAFKDSHTRSAIHYGAGSVAVAGVIGAVSGLPLLWIPVIGVAAMVTSEGVLGLPFSDKAKYRRWAAAQEKMSEQLESQLGRVYLADMDARKKMETYKSRAADVKKLCAHMENMVNSKQIGMSLRDLMSLKQVHTRYLLLLSSWGSFYQSGKDAAKQAHLAIAECLGLVRELRNPVNTHDQMYKTKALRDWYDVYQREVRKRARMALTEARLASMPLKVEEVYQMVLANPEGQDFTEQLESALAQMLSDEVTSERIDAEIEALMPSGMQVYNEDDLEHLSEERLLSALREMQNEQEPAAKVLAATSEKIVQISDKPPARRRAPRMKVEVDVESSDVVRRPRAQSAKH